MTTWRLPGRPRRPGRHRGLKLADSSAWTPPSKRLPCPECGRPITAREVYRPHHTDGPFGPMECPGSGRRVGFEIEWAIR